MLLVHMHIRMYTVHVRMHVRPSTKFTKFSTRIIMFNYVRKHKVCTKRWLNTIPTHAGNGPQW
jgi:hypothetical protein